MYLLGYLPRDGRMYLADKDVGVVSFALSLSVVEYQTLVLRGDMEAASELLENVPSDQMNKIARFLEGQGYRDLALDVATDPEHRFELALSLSKLDIALDLAREADVEHKWKTVGDAALQAWDLSLAEECFTKGKDLGSLLLLLSSSGHTDGLRRLAQQAELSGSHNVAFSSLWQLADVDACIDLLLQTNRIPESALFAQTYRPSRAHSSAVKWKESLEKAGKPKVARIIGVPPTTEEAGEGEDAAETQFDDDLFPEWDEYIRLEKEGVPAPTAPLVDVNGEANESEEEDE